MADGIKIPPSSSYADVTKRVAQTSPDTRFGAAESDILDPTTSQRITKSVPRMPDTVAARPVHKNYASRLHAITDPLEHQAHENAMRMSQLYTLKHLTVLKELPDRQITEIHAWVDSTDGIIQRFSDQMLPAEVINERWQCVLLYLYRSRGHLFVDDVYADLLKDSFAEWFVKQRGMRIPAPADGEIYRPVQTSPDVQKRHNNSKLHGLYAHPEVEAMFSGDMLIMEAWVNVMYGMIATISMPNTYVGDAEETRVGMMVECDRHGLLVFFNDLKGLSEMPQILRRYFENPVHSTIPPDGWTAKEHVSDDAEDSEAQSSDTVNGFMFTDSDVRGGLASSGVSGRQSSMIVARDVRGNVDTFQEISTSAIGAPQGIAVAGAASPQSIALAPTMFNIPPVKR